MRIRVKKGAVINLLVNTQGSYNLDGAVVSIDDNEIVLQPQVYVAVQSVTNHKGFIGTNQIRNDVTMDAPTPALHIDRNIIIGWTYSAIPTPETAGNAVYSGYVITGEMNYDKLHLYKNGICEGKGPDLD